MASYNAINKVVAGLVLEAKKQVIADFAAFLGEKIDFDEDMTGYFAEFTKTLQVEKPPKAGKGKKASDDGVAKKKRAPSAYNIYIKNKMAEIKEKKPELKGKDLMKAAIEAWNADKADKATADASAASEVVESSDDNDE